MAEKIVSPGVFTNERDLSFLPQAIGEIGAAIIGPTIKGPAFEPTIVESFKEFEMMFGPKTKESYVPYTVEQYLKSAGRVTIVRILGLNGYRAQCIDIAVSGSYNLDASPDAGGRTVAVLESSQVDPTAKFYAISASTTRCGVTDTLRDDFDFHLPMGSLYKNFIQKITTTDKVDAFLVPNPDRVKYWKKRLKSLGQGPYIGVSWKSANMQANRLQNHASIIELSPVLKIPDVKFINYFSAHFYIIKRFWFPRFFLSDWRAFPMNPRLEYSIFS